MVMIARSLSLSSPSSAPRVAYVEVPASYSIVAKGVCSSRAKFGRIMAKIVAMSFIFSASYSSTFQGMITFSFSLSVYRLTQAAVERLRTDIILACSVAAAACSSLISLMEIGSTGLPFS